MLQHSPNPKSQIPNPLRTILSTLLFLVATTSAASELSFRVTLDSSVAERPLTGRLYVFLSRTPFGEPRSGPDWFHPEPFFGADVKDLKPGESFTIDDNADGFPGKLSTLEPGRYRVQALFDQNLDFAHHAQGVGNPYSDVLDLSLDPAESGEVSLALNKVVEEQPMAESDYIREIKLESRLLSEFHSRPVVERAAVILPAGYHDHPERRYPVIFSIPGFGGDHRVPPVFANGFPPPEQGEAEFIRVMLSGQCKWGHHVYADSATNGPRGRSLVEEMIPKLDAEFRIVPAATARFVTGHSSGGWSSLWLQVAYPDTFGGVWSSAPDPVDFRDYQQVDLYAEPSLSLYFNEQGDRRPLARQGETPVVWYDSFGKMDDCIGRGGQLRSFEAVFSPLGDDGLPQKLWDRETGRIDPQVAKAWEKYDIRLVLERNWETLAPKLAGKLHIVTGSLDTFYLEGAVEQLAGTLKDLGSDAEITIVPGADHGSVLTPDRMIETRRQMSESYRKHHPD